MNRKWLFVIFILSVLGIGSAGMGISQIEDSIKAQQVTSILTTMENTALDSQDASWLEKSEDRSFEWLVHDGAWGSKQNRRMEGNQRGGYSLLHPGQYILHDKRRTG
ncbi:hypothetical protein [Brevibacillus formosus]|uniref:hypothetical protein n=1 Tax=Brevibacillus formosus TaxID=54913 RepID=UPI0012FE3804|nr:hypothetical protein [Brevibacillus formosus]